MAGAARSAVKQGSVPGENLVQSASAELSVDTAGNIIHHAVYRP